MNEIEGFHEDDEEFVPQKNIIKEGYLLKEGHLKKNWKKRWFVVSPSEITYYEDHTKKRLKGSVPLGTCTITPPKNERKEEHSFRISSNNIKGVGIYGEYPKYILAAETAEEKKEWFDLLTRLADTNRRRLQPSQ
eukprot:Rmarinus@m.2661